MKAGSFITNPCWAPLLCLELLPAVLSIWLLSKWVPQEKQSSLEGGWVQRFRLCCPTSRPEFGVLTFPKMIWANCSTLSFSLPGFPSLPLR